MMLTVLVHILTSGHKLWVVTERVNKYCIEGAKEIPLQGCCAILLSVIG